MNIKDIPPHTLITGVAAIAWLGSFGLRALNPEFALGPAADALMTTVVGYWFTVNKKSGKDDGSGLLEEVVTSVAMPMIATAHSSKPAAPNAPTSPAPPAPRPVTPPVRPTPPPAQGGLPWG